MNLWPQSATVVSWYGYTCGHGRLDIRRRRTLSSRRVREREDERYERREIHSTKEMLKLMAG